MSPVEEKLQDRIAKLLTQAEGTDYQHEADTFFAKAEELMLQHAISEDAVRARMGQTRTDKIVKKSFSFKGIFRSTELLMGHMVGEAFGFRTVRTKRYGENVEILTWVGFERELDDAEVIFTSLQIQCARALKSFAREYKANNPWAGKQDLYVARRSFIEAYGVTAAQRITATQRRVVQDAAEVDKSLVPMLREKSDLINSAVEEMYPHLKKARAAKRDVSAAGMLAGRDAAKRADVGAKKINGRRELS